MDMDNIKNLLDSESISKHIEKAETESEQQLIALLLIRKNLNDIRQNVASIKSWVTFFAVLTIIGLVVNLLF